MFYFLDITISDKFIYGFLIVLLILVLIALIYITIKQNQNIIKQINNQDNHDSNDKKTESSPKEIEDLQSLTKELENIPKGKNIQLTSYEEEQEQTAIISYEELIKQNQQNNENISEMDLPKLSNRKINQENNNSYEHEEEFLKNLKELKKSLN